MACCQNPSFIDSYPTKLKPSFIVLSWPCLIVKSPNVLFFFFEIPAFPGVIASFHIKTSQVHEGVDNFVGAEKTCHTCLDGTLKNNSKVR